MIAAEQLQNISKELTRLSNIVHSYAREMEDYSQGDLIECSHQIDDMAWLLMRATKE